MYDKPMHISAQFGQIASLVLLAGDPFRAKYIAETFLENPTLVSDTRGMLFFTGQYKDKTITVGSHGMGASSVAIYVDELYRFFNVQTIMRIGSSGAYSAKLKLNDIVNVSAAFGDNNFDERLLGLKLQQAPASPQIVATVQQAALAQNISSILHTGVVHSSDLFYKQMEDDWKTIARANHALSVEMECWTLFLIALQYKRQAGCVLSIVHTLEDDQWTEAKDKYSLFDKVAKLALKSFAMLV